MSLHYSPSPPLLPLPQLHTIQCGHSLWCSSSSLFFNPCLQEGDGDALLWLQVSLQWLQRRGVRHRASAGTSRLEGAPHHTLLPAGHGLAHQGGCTAHPDPAAASAAAVTFDPGRWVCKEYLFPSDPGDWTEADTQSVDDFSLQQGLYVMI